MQIQANANQYFFMIFKNPQVDPTQLPQIGTVVFKKLAPAYKSTEYIGTGILYAFLLVGATAIFFKASSVLGVYRYGIILVWAMLLLASMLLVSKKYELAGYALREHDVIHKHGVWWHTVTAVPFNRMQHCEISQGPVQNAFGLATLRIFTAGGTNSDLSIDGLEHEEAKRIKDFITGKINGQDSGGSPQSSVLSSQSADEAEGRYGMMDNVQDANTTAPSVGEKQNPIDYEPI